jgi:hypothetical protein
MVAASYRKMYLRGTHAYSQHSLDILSTLTPENMQDIFKKHASGVKLSSRKDHDLGSMLISLHEQEELQSILDVHLTEYKASVGLQHRNIRSLIDAFRTVLLSRSEEGMGAYNEQTCFTFHLLLVATISGFIKSLVSLDEATKAKKKADRAKTAADFNLAADQEIYAEHVVQFGRLLWHFAYSQMLNLHLELLEKGNFLRTPIDPHMGPQRNPAPIDGDGDDEDNNEDTDDMPDELKRSEKDKAVTFRRWIQILVSYWAAINVLAKFNTRQGTDSANITLVHVRGKLDYKNMAPWDDIIRKLASLSAADGSQVPFNADFAIASFIERIEDPNQDSKIVKAFRKKSKNCEECLLVAAAPRDVDFVGNLHCEVLLGTILEYFWNIKIGGNKEYVKLFEVLMIVFICIHQTDFPYRVQIET